MVGLCLPTALKNTRVWLKGYMTEKQYMSFATVLCLIPENVYGRM